MPSALQLSVHTEEWAAKAPFRITGLSRDSFRVVVVELNDGNYIGRGEGLPVYYLQETVGSLCRQIEACAGSIRDGITRETLLKAMPPGGARNAVDSALWDLEAKCAGRTIWELTGIAPKAVSTAFTIGMEETLEAMAAKATDAFIYPTLKIKVDSTQPVERVAAIKAARPDAVLIVDANGAWTFKQLVEFAPRLAEMGVRLIEQPLPRGGDETLEGYAAPIPLCADESCQHRGELDEASRRYQIINMKLDKLGGLTEALELAKVVRDKGLELFVGNMGGTSLSMAPAFVLAQLCNYVDLDGPLMLKHDRLPSLHSHGGQITGLDPRLWG